MKTKQNINNKSIDSCFIKRSYNRACKKTSLFNYKISCSSKNKVMDINFSSNDICSLAKINEKSFNQSDINDLHQLSSKDKVNKIIASQPEKSCSYLLTQNTNEKKHKKRFSLSQIEGKNIIIGNYSANNVKESLNSFISKTSDLKNDITLISKDSIDKQTKKPQANYQKVVIENKCTKDRFIAYQPIIEGKQNINENHNNIDFQESFPLDKSSTNITNILNKYRSNACTSSKMIQKNKKNKKIQISKYFSNLKKTINLSSLNNTLSFKKRRQYNKQTQLEVFLSENIDNSNLKNNIQINEDDPRNFKKRSVSKKSKSQSDKILIQSSPNFKTIHLNNNVNKDIYSITDQNDILSNTDIEVIDSNYSKSICSPQLFIDNVEYSSVEKSLNKHDYFESRNHDEDGELVKKSQNIYSKSNNILTKFDGNRYNNSNKKTFLKIKSNSQKVFSNKINDLKENAELSQKPNVKRKYTLSQPTMAVEQLNDLRCVQLPLSQTQPETVKFHTSVLSIDELHEGQQSSHGAMLDLIDLDKHNKDADNYCDNEYSMNQFLDSDKVINSFMKQSDLDTDATRSQTNDNINICSLFEHSINIQKDQFAQNTSKDLIYRESDKQIVSNANFPEEAQVYTSPAKVSTTVDLKANVKHMPILNCISESANSDIFLIDVANNNLMNIYRNIDDSTNLKINSENMFYSEICKDKVITESSLNINNNQCKMDKNLELCDSSNTFRQLKYLNKFNYPQENITSTILGAESSKVILSDNANLVRSNSVIDSDQLIDYHQFSQEISDSQLASILCDENTIKKNEELDLCFKESFDKIDSLKRFFKEHIGCMELYLKHLSE